MQENCDSLYNCFQTKKKKKKARVIYLEIEEFTVGPFMCQYTAKDFLSTKILLSVILRVKIRKSSQSYTKHTVRFFFTALPTSTSRKPKLRHIRV